METHYKAEHVNLPIPECFIKKKNLDMALGGRVSVFGVKFLNKVDIRNFHECYPLHHHHHFFEQVEFHILLEVLVVEFLFIFQFIELTKQN